MTFHGVIRHILPCNVMSWYIMICRDMSRHDLTGQGLWRHAMACHVFIWHAKSWHEMSWHSVTRHVMSYHDMAWNEMQWHVFPDLFVWPLFGQNAFFGAFCKTFSSIGQNSKQKAIPMHRPAKKPANKNVHTEGKRSLTTSRVMGTLVWGTPISGKRSLGKPDFGENCFWQIQLWRYWTGHR